MADTACPLPEPVRAALQACVDEIQYLRRRATFPAGHWLVLQNIQERACEVLNADYRAKHGEPARRKAEHPDRACVFDLPGEPAGNRPIWHCSCGAWRVGESVQINGQGAKP